jgi:cytochrome c oxidase assembly protein subunit 15
MFLEVWHVRTEAVPRNLYRLAQLVAAAAVVMLVTGTFATAAGPHPGSHDEVTVARLGDFERSMYIHVRATAVFAVAFAGLAIWLLRRRGGKPGFELALFGVLLLQMIVGEVQHRADPQWWVVLVHVMLAGTLWAGIVALVASLRPPSRIRR